MNVIGPSPVSWLHPRSNGQVFPNVIGELLLKGKQNSQDLSTGNKKILRLYGKNEILDQKLASVFDTRLTIKTPLVRWIHPIGNMGS